MSKTKDGELLTLDAIRSGIRFQRSVAEGWIKVSKELVCTPDLLLEICVSQNLEKLGGGGEAHKMSGMERGENWSKLCSLGGPVSTLTLSCMM